jgi:hypothetical protein
VSWLSTDIGAPGAAITSEPGRETTKTLLDPGSGRTIEEAHRLDPAKLELAAGEAKPKLLQALVAIDEQRLQPRRIAVRACRQDTRIGAAGGIKRHQLARLPAFEIAHRHMIAGFDVDQHRTATRHVIALHAGQQQARLHDQARTRRAGHNFGVD